MKDLPWDSSLTLRMTTKYMDTNELVSRYAPFLKKHWIALGLGALGVIFFAYGLIGLFLANKSASENITFEDSSEKNSMEEKTILVDIEGAVVKSGLYKLSYNSRIQDGLIAAGGLAAKADRDYVAKNLNLATKLTDGAKIYIPYLGEAVSGMSVLNASENIVGSFLNINTSSQAQLEILSGIGPVTASKIIGGRPYSSIEELLSSSMEL